LLSMNVPIAPGLHRAMAVGVLSLHAAYIGWVVFGALFTRGRPRLAALHVAALMYGMIIEIFGFWCPLTAIEEWLDVRGDVSVYRGPFLLHYLDAMVYPDISPNLLIAGAVAVCILNLWIYARRLRIRHSLG
jgi:Protein of Unknown function (DUF2784)